MDDHQNRLWKSMVDLINSYLSSENQDFNRIVGELEGALDASEINDVNLINQWYDFWTPLEIRRSVEKDHLNKAKTIEELNAMKSLLLTVIHHHNSE